MTNASLYTIIEDHIAVITFVHPSSNSFPRELSDRLVKELQRLSNADEVYVIILKSEGERAFCAGAFFDELIAITNMEEGEKVFMGFANLINAMRSCSKLIIGRVQGKAVGGGVGVIAACDYALATEAASIKLSELTIGIGPFVIEPAITRKMGTGAFSELTLDASSWHNAYWAREKGLYAKVLPTIEKLDDEIDLLANRLSNYNPETLYQIKKKLWQGTSNWSELLIERAQISSRLALSNYSKKKLEAFKKKK